MKRRSGLIKRAGGVAGLVNEYTGLNMIFPGHIDYTARTTAPAGWMACDGRALSRSVYASLFAAIGTTYGAGDGSTTFNIPDLRGEFIRGVDGGRGVDVGRVQGSAQASQNLAHTHSSRRGSSVGSGYTGASGQTNFTTYFDDIPTTSNGGTEARPRNVALLAIIRY